MKAILISLALSLVACGKAEKEDSQKEPAVKSLAASAVDPRWTPEVKTYFAAGCEYEVKLQGYFWEKPWTEEQAKVYCGCLFEAMTTVASLEEYLGAPMKYYGVLFEKGYQDTCKKGL